jgi:predicted transcriptional regulator
MLSEWMEVETQEVPRVRKQMGTSGYAEETGRGTYLILRFGITVQFGQVQSRHFY